MLAGGGHGGAADKDDRIVLGPGAGTVVSQGPGLGIADARRELRAIGGIVSVTKPARLQGFSVSLVGMLPAVGVYSSVGAGGKGVSVAGISSALCEGIDRAVWV